MNRPAVAAAAPAVSNRLLLMSGAVMAAAALFAAPAARAQSQPDGGAPMVIHAVAMRLNAARMNEVMTALRRAGIEERYVQTSGLNLSAQYDYVQNEPPRLRGYQANNRVTVIINDLTKVGTTADAVVAAGVNQIDGISFGLKDPTSAENQARQLAVRNLQAKAALYAQALGVQLGGIRSLSEGGGYAPAPPMPMYAMRAEMAQDAGSTPVAAGQLTVRIDITGVYDLVR
jgi:uncharacterized protein YggE